MLATSDFSCARSRTAKHPSRQRTNVENIRVRIYFYGIRLGPQSCRKYTRFSRSEYVKRCRAWSVRNKRASARPSRINERPRRKIDVWGTRHPDPAKKPVKLGAGTAMLCPYTRQLPSTERKGL